MLRKIMMHGMILGALMIGRKASAATATAEVVSGDASSTLDVKVSGEVAPRFGLFTRHRETVDYDNNLRHFSLADATYTVGNGVGAVVETQFIPNLGVVPRLGFQYATARGDLDVFVLATAVARENTNGEGVTLFRYSPPLHPRARLFAQIETVTNIGKGGHNFSVERLRLGLDIHGYRFGAAADITEKGDKLVPCYNVGGFVARNF